MDSVNNFPHYCCFNGQYPQFKIVLKFHNNVIHTFSDAEKHGPKSIPFELQPKHTVLLMCVQTWYWQSKCWGQIQHQSKRWSWWWGIQETSRHYPHCFFFFLWGKWDQNDMHHILGEPLKTTCTTVTLNLHLDTKTEARKEHCPVTTLPPSILPISNFLIMRKMGKYRHI